MDILDAEPYYEEHFKFKHTEPVTDKFDQFGVGDKVFILNSGSFLVMNILIILLFVLRYYMNKVSSWFSRNRFARSFGVFTHDPNKYTLR